MRPYKFLCTLGILVTGSIQSSVQIGADYTYANIKVGGEKAFKGNLGGLQALFEYKSCLYGGFEVAWREGTTKNSFAKRKLTYVDVQERVGYSFNWVTVFSGFGYRFLGHKLEESETVRFNYNEFYIPLGVLSEYQFDCHWTFGLNVTWMPQVYPTVEIVPLKGARWDLRKKAGNVKAALPVTYSWNKCYSVVIKPTYEHWEDGKSTAKTFSGEELGLPGNSYNFWGVEVNFEAAF